MYRDLASETKSKNAIFLIIFRFSMDIDLFTISFNLASKYFLNSSLNCFW